MFIRGDPDIKETAISGDEEEQLSMPEDAEVPNQRQKMPDDIVEEYIDKAFNTPYIQHP